MILFQLLVFLVVCGLVYYLVMMLPLPPPFKMIIQAIMILCAIYWLLGLAGFIPGGHLHFR